MKVNENSKFSKQALHDAVISSNVEDIWNATKETMRYLPVPKFLRLRRYQYGMTERDYHRCAFDEAIEILEKNGFTFIIDPTDDGFVQMILDDDIIKNLPQILPYRERCKNFKKILSKNE